MSKNTQESKLKKKMCICTIKKKDKKINGKKTKKNSNNKGY